MSQFFWIMLLGFVAFASLPIGLAISIMYKSRAAKTGEKSAHLTGEVGTVLYQLEPEGAVMINGELWNARSIDGTNVEKGAAVRVVRPLGPRVPRRGDEIKFVAKLNRSAYYSAGSAPR